jgi:NADH-quinone oxidoreductase subunit L
VGRQLVLVFAGQPRSAAAEGAAESNWLMTVPLIALAVGTVLAGLFNFPTTHALADWLSPVVPHGETPKFMPELAAAFTALGLGGLAAAWWRYRRPEDRLNEAETALGRFLASAWRFDAAYYVVVVKPFYALSTICAQVLDVGLIDRAVNGVGRLFRQAGMALRSAQSGFVRSYGLLMLAGVVLALAYFVLNAR